MSSATAVVPARNEAGRVGATVRALLGIPGIDRVIVVDDASEDGTSGEALAAGAEVVRLARRRGKGGALAAGLERTEADVILLVDADLAETAGAVSALLRIVERGEADMAVAAPARTGGPSGVGLVERLARAGIRRLTGRTLDRPLSGQRALRREVLRRARPPSARFGVEVGLTVDALRAGLRVVEVPCEFRHATTGRDVRGFLHRARQGKDVLLALGARAGRDGRAAPGPPRDPGRASG